MGEYKLILCDCPWLYDNMQQNDPARGGITYSTLSMKDLYELPIHTIAADDSILVSWVTFPKLCDRYYELYDPLSIIRHWGFRPVTALFVWVKLNKNRRIRTFYNDPFEHDDEDECYLQMDDFYSGLGRYTNSNVEIAIVARRGKGLERRAKDVKQLIFSPIREHSAKPPEQYDRLKQLYGDVKRIELFARKSNLPPTGWDYTGLESDGKDIRDFLTEIE